MNQETRELRKTTRELRKTLYGGDVYICYYIGGRSGYKVLRRYVVNNFSLLIPTFFLEIKNNFHMDPDFDEYSIINTWEYPDKLEDLNELEIKYIVNGMMASYINTDFNDFQESSGFRIFSNNKELTKEDVEYLLDHSKEYI